MRSWFLALWEFGSGPVCLCESGVPLAFHSEPLPVGSSKSKESAVGGTGGYRLGAGGDAGVPEV
jgi:hypothetical protein